MAIISHNTLIPISVIQQVKKMPVIAGNNFLLKQVASLIAAAINVTGNVRRAPVVDHTR